MPQKPVRAAALIAACGTALLAGAVERAVAGTFTCNRKGELCDGHVRVPLDRAGRIPGTIDLAVTVDRLGNGRGVGLMLADDLGPNPDDQGSLAIVSINLDPLVGNGRLIELDRRGSRGSGRISCRAHPDLAGLVQRVARCAAELGPARAAYTTAESVADVEAVRDAVGIERMTVYGVGRGAQLALAYAAAHPDHVARLLLDSPLPPAGADPFQRSALRSLGRIERAACAGVCPATADLSGELATLVRRTTRAPLRGRVIDGRGHPRIVSIGPAEVLRTVLAGETNEYAIGFLPTAVHGALAGDLAPLARLVAVYAPAPAAIDAAQLAATCNDGAVPWAPGTPIALRPAAANAALAGISPAALAPFGPAPVRGLETVDRCVGWPDSPVAQPHPPLPSIPTLVLSGELDFATPLADAAALSHAIPGARLVRVPGLGHGVMDNLDLDSTCVPAVLSSFARGGTAPCRSPRVPGVPPTRPARTWELLPPVRLAAVPPARGRLPIRAARTLTAARMTWSDALEQLVSGAALGAREIRVGGLRAGFAHFSGGNLKLHGYSYVPGVTVTIGIAGRRPFLEIGGRAAVHARLGTLTLCGDGACFAGRMAGRLVHVTVSYLTGRYGRARD